jgi:hypothetical protein
MTRRALLLALFVVACSDDATTPTTADAGTDAGALDATPTDGAAKDAGDAAACGAKNGACCTDSLCNAGLVCTGATCIDAVQPATCSGTGWSFVAEVAPPAKMAPYQRFTMFATFRNCTGKTVPRVDVGSPTGMKLAFSAPRDLDPFGVGRIALPADVPDASDVTIPIVLRGPPLTGPYYLRFGLLDEGVAWLPVETTAHVVDVEATAKTATICPNVTADLSGATPATAALVACIKATPSGGVLELPPGVYQVDGELSLAQPITIRTAGTTPQDPDCWDHDSPACAILRAADGLSVPRGFVYVRASTGVHLDRIVLDGNRGARLKSAAAATCAGGTNGAGFNAHSDDCASCSMRRGMSARALCGTGWEWTGDGATIEKNVFWQNGDHATKNMWSDGLTLLRSNGAKVQNNRFVDDSDIDFICGGATNAVFSGNYVQHVLQATFGGIMLDNFNGGTPGNFDGASVTNNVVQCGTQLCDFGIQLGPHPWYPSANVIGGSVTNNTVTGAKIQIDAEGAGTAAKPMVVSGNTLGPSPASAVFGCGQTRAATQFNVSPDSFVTTTNGTAKLTFHACP